MVLIHPSVVGGCIYSPPFQPDLAPSPYQRRYLMFGQRHHSRMLNCKEVMRVIHLLHLVFHPSHKISEVTTCDGSRALDMTPLATEDSDDAGFSDNSSGVSSRLDSNRQTY
ncbi:hypothetical protein BaRGS_00000267 [Batillaria attramentaria]|uniref:Uncharacterized protein n=1 Tax=Batillaria attramentaria TaxID=370345 RepID=A0ABD0MCC8_9CAEN